MQTWNWFASSTAHYGSTGAGAGLGETRVKIISCGFMSYYSPRFTSEALVRVGVEQHFLNLTGDEFWMGPGANETRLNSLTSLMRRRRAHDLRDISGSDAKVMKIDSEAILIELLSGNGNCSGMDWVLMSNEIVQTYAGSIAGLLKSLQAFNTTSQNITILKDWMIDVRDRTHTLLLPFLRYPASSLGVDYGRDSRLFDETYSRCRFHHTRLLDPQEGIALGPGELTTKWALEETTSGICNVLVDIGLSIEHQWQARFNIPTNDILPLSLKKEVQRWMQGLEELMAWLSWAGEWTFCPEQCGRDEKCFIPMWPLLGLGTRLSGEPPHWIW